MLNDLEFEPPQMALESKIRISHHSYLNTKKSKFFWEKMKNENLGCIENICKYVDSRLKRMLKARAIRKYNFLPSNRTSVLENKPVSEDTGSFQSTVLLTWCLPSIVTLVNRPLCTAIIDYYMPARKNVRSTRLSINPHGTSLFLWIEVHTSVM